VIAQSAALVLLAMGAHGSVPADAPALRVIDQPASRTFDPDAEKEMAVARWYMTTRHDPVGAINRLKIVVSQHRGSTQVEEAVALLAQAYLTLGIIDEAQSAVAALQRHFPAGNWYPQLRDLLKSEGFEPHGNPRSWITRALD